MGPISGFVIICLLLTLGYLVGFLTFLTEQQENKCEMTYMFEYPQFVKISSPSDKHVKKYGLYAYSEGRFIHKVRKMDFNGVPVLFIPGNAGSYKQVRSFASVALRKALDSRPGFHFDFFTIDLNSELSGLNGALLNEQMRYVRSSLQVILGLYKNNEHPKKSIIIIGHSMGGIIARGLLTTLSKNSTFLPLVITLATPHLRPPVALDTFLVEFYEKIENASSLPVNSTIIAVSGGYNDFIISPHITSSKKFENLQVATTSVPLVWLPNDHLCIMWCKQLVLAITRGLFDLVDPRSKQITLNTQFYKEVFQYHLIKNSGTKSYKIKNYDLPVVFGKNNHQWIENLQTQYSISMLNGTKHPQWRMIRLLSETTHQSLTILALNLEVSDWAFACSANYVQAQTRICQDGIRLSHLSDIAPSIRYKRRTLHLNLHELKKNFTEITHIVVRVLPTKEPVVIHVDVHNSKERKVEVSLPRWWSLNQQVIIEKTLNKVLNYELILPQLQHIIQSYKLYVQPIKCNSSIHHAVATLRVPWANHDIHGYFTEIERDPFHVRLYNSKPRHLNDSHASLILTLDPACIYTISIQSSFVGMLGQLARTYSSFLVANMVAVVLLAFRRQLMSIHETATCSVLLSAISCGVKPYYILTMVKVASRLFSLKMFLHVLPQPDWEVIAEEGNDFFLLPLLLYMCAVGLVWISTLAIGFALVFCESVFHKGITKFLARTVAAVVKISDWIVGGIDKLPSTVALLLALLSINTCGALALCLGCAFYFLKLTKMSQEYVEGLALKIAMSFSKTIFRRRNENNTNSSQSSINTSKLLDTDVNRAKEGENSENNVKDSISESEENKQETNEGETDLSNQKPDVSNSKEDNEGDIDNGVIRREPAEHSAIFFHLSLFLLWCIATIINVPYVLTWAHNFKYNSILKPDPSFLPGFVFSLCAIPLWHLDLPKSNISYYPLLGYIFNGFAAVCLIYAPISIYRVVNIITIVILLVTLHQCLAPTRLEINNEDEGGEEPPTESEAKSLFGVIKSKWE